jgi:hypothetical protein
MRRGEGEGTGAGRREQRGGGWRRLKEQEGDRYNALQNNISNVSLYIAS